MFIQNPGKISQNAIAVFFGCGTMKFLATLHIMFDKFMNRFPKSIEFGFHEIQSFLPFYPALKLARHIR